jgi:hypothetical protein
MKYLMFCLIFLLPSCRKAPWEVFDTGFEIIVENNIGENLLVATTPGVIDWNTLKLFYLIDNKPVEVYQGNLSCPRNICFVDEPGYERLTIFANTEGTSENTVTLLQWNDQDIDTITCHIVRKNNNSYKVVDKIWFNSVLMYPDSALEGLNRAFKIVK